MHDSTRLDADETLSPRITGPAFANHAALLGALLLFGLCGYRRIWHPDWSGADALSVLWPLYLLGGLPIVVRWVIAQPWASGTAAAAMVAWRKQAERWSGTRAWRRRRTAPHLGA